MPEEIHGNTVPRLLVFKPYLDYKEIYFHNLYFAHKIGNNTFS